MPPEKGLGMPNLQYVCYPAADEQAALDLNPQALLFLIYHDSPSLPDKIAQDARIWNQAGRPRALGRFFTGNLKDWQPEELAYQLCLVDEKYRAAGMALEWIPFNEADIEGLGEDWQAIAVFYTIVAIGIQMRSPRIRRHFPALSRNVTDMRAALTALAGFGVFDHAEVADLHCYTEADLQDAAPLHEISGLPVRVTEVNQMPPSFYLPKLNQPYVEGADWFILSGAEDQRQYWLRGSAFYDNFKRTKLRGADMTLAEQYPEIYEAWVEAGGPENNFRKHLLGIGAITASKEDLDFLADEAASGLAQLKGTMDSFLAVAR